MDNNFEVIPDPGDTVTVNGVEYMTFYVALDGHNPAKIAHGLEVDYCRDCGMQNYCPKHLKESEVLYAPIV